MKKEIRCWLSTIPQSRPENSKTSEEPSAFSPPAISLPKGGGAIRGIGEKFAANPVTGTGSMTVPIATSPGRSGFGPQLALSYVSGSGNGPFGIGWILEFPSISIKTEKGLPRYDGTDTYLMSRVEDLVPVLTEQISGWQQVPLFIGEYRIDRFHPRIEGLFARIERWTHRENGDVHWRTISKDNLITLYGTTSASRVFDPAHPSHIFRWLICESYDDKGNVILYEYKEENSACMDPHLAHEANRSEISRSANRYPHRIRYGNLPSALLQPDRMQLKWLFEIIFDYGENYLTDRGQNERGFATVEFKPTPSGEWQVRSDPFSTHRAGFEIRTYRLCHRVVMVHHFPPENSLLVRTTDFSYSQNQTATTLAAVTQTSYLRNGPSEVYQHKSPPPVEFEYSPVTIDHTVRTLDPDSLENLPAGLTSCYVWVDLDGEGLSGILSEQAGAWYYKPNWGNGRFGPQRLVPWITSALIMTRESRIRLRLHYVGLQRLQILFQEILCERFLGIRTWANMSPLLKTTRRKLNKVPEPKTREMPSYITCYS